MPDLAEKQKELAAKVRLLDKLFALIEDDKVQLGLTEYDLGFICSLKDWVDKKGRAITKKQGQVIERIFLKYDDLKAGDLIEPMNGFTWDWTSFVEEGRKYG